MRSSERAAAGALAFALFVAAAPAGAFVAPMHMPVLPSNYTSSIMQAVVLNPCQPGTTCGDAAAKNGVSPWKVPASGGAAPGRPHPFDPAATHYTPSPDVTQRVKAEFVEQIGHAAGPAEAQKVRTVLEGHDITALWAREMAPNGLHLNDMADAVASYWVLNWIMANHADTTPAQTRAVRDQIQRVMAGGRLAQLPNAGRQAVAETAMIEFVTQSAIYVNAVKTHDADTVAKLGDAAESRFRAQMNIDLRGLVLTGQGFSRKG